MILVARHVRSADDLFDAKLSPPTVSLLTAAVQWAKRIMRNIDGVEATEKRSFQMSGEKLERNNPCSCGRGKKYKEVLRFSHWAAEPANGADSP